MKFSFPKNIKEYILNIIKIINVLPKKIKNVQLKKKYTSNVLYFYNNVQFDRTNVQNRIDLAMNLENLNNNSNALYHLYVAHEIDSSNQFILKLIVRNLLKMNDIFEAFKWSLKIKNLKRSDIFLNKNEYQLFFNHSYFSKFNNTFVYFGSKKENYPMWNNVSKIQDFAKIDLIKSKFFFVDNYFEKLFIDFMKKKRMKNIICVISLNCLLKTEIEVSKKLKQIENSDFFLKIINNYIPFLDEQKKHFCYTNDYD